MTWKAALLTALKARRRSHFFRAVFVATPATVIGSFEKGIGTGLLLGAWIAVAIFVLDAVGDARKARRRARGEASRVSD